MQYDLILELLVLGCVSGFLAGLLGIGGGLIIVPVLVYLFKQVSIDPSVSMHIAIGSSLAIIMITSASSVWRHHKKQSVRWDVLRFYAPGLSLGAFAGGTLAAYIPGKVLAYIMAVFIFVTAIKMLMDKPKQLDQANQLEVTKPTIRMTMMGSLFGSLSSMLGIGGGTFTVPYLNHLKIPMQQAIGTASAGGFPIALFGATAYAISGMDYMDVLPEHTTGFLLWPAIYLVGITGLLSAQLGAMAAHRLPVKILKRIFAILMFVIGSSLIAQF